MSLTKLIVASSIVLMLVYGMSCGPRESYTNNYATEPTGSLPQTSFPTPTPNPPMNVRIDYFGVKCADPRGDDISDYLGEVKLVVAVSDGISTETWAFPPVEEYKKMDYFETTAVHQRVFHTSSVGEYLHVYVVAYDDDSEQEVGDFFSLAQALLVPGADVLSLFFEYMPKDEDLIGYYQAKWYSDENWGMGQYNEVGVDNLELWLSVYSGTEPSTPSLPQLSPKVRLEELRIPAEVKLSDCIWGYPTY